MRKVLVYSENRNFITNYISLLEEESIQCDSTLSLDSFISSVEISAPSSLVGFLDLRNDTEEVTEILKRLHSTARGKELPLIILHHNPKDILSHQRAIRMGVNFFFTQPVEIDQLVNAACTLSTYGNTESVHDDTCFVKMRGYLRSKTENPIYFAEEPLENFQQNYLKMVKSETLFRQHPFPTEQLGESINGNHELFRSLNEKEAVLWAYLFQYIRVLEKKIDTLTTALKHQEQPENSPQLLAGSGHLMDMSGGGCRFRTNKIIELGTLLNLKIILEEFPPENVICIGIITHTNPQTETQGMREYALKYVAIHPKDKEKLIKYTIHLEQLEIQRKRETPL